jgi:predicted RND superfamily exporter protein
VQLASFWEGLARSQARRPGVYVLVVGAVVALCAWLASHLTVLAGFEHMLPDGRASVLELRRVMGKTAGVSTLFVVIETPADKPADRAALREASTRLTESLRKIGDPYIGSADNGVRESVRFFEERAGLYADKAALEQLRDDVKANFDYAVAKELGTLLDEAPPPPIDEAGIKKRFGIDDTLASRYPDGYFESADGRTHVITARSKILGGDLQGGKAALARVEAAIDAAKVDATLPGAKVSLSGDLYTGVAEVKAINDDVTEVGLLGAALIAGIVFLYYLRTRTLLLMTVVVGVGLVVTAGLTYALVGSLNTATGFVFTIIAGSGINTSIIFMARYLEVRRAGRGLEEAFATAHAETNVATFCAAAASAASFFALLGTAFRGFRELGLIGGLGLVVCWLGTIVALPPLLALLEKFAPIRASTEPGAKPSLVARIRGAWEQSFGRPFVFLVSRAPRALTVGGVALALVGYVALARYATRDPFEYEMKNIRNDPASRAAEERVRTIADGITGYVGAEGMAILVDDVADVAPLRATLYARRDAAPADARPFDRLVALEDFVPADQPAKLELLHSLRQLLLKARKRKAVSDDEWAKLERFVPPEGLEPVTLATLPEGVARPFTEVDGSRGRIVFIVPTHPDLTEDARYLLRWADAYRETKLPNGKVVVGSGRAVIYADMWAAVMSAVPTAVALSLLAVAIVVALTFRAVRPVALVLGALLVGIGWMALWVSIAQIKLNFLNFVALPLTFGIGVDYAVNVMWRANREGPKGALVAVEATGGAVVLCSLTTTLGYLALVGSMNLAVRGLGLAAVIGEVSTLLAAMLVLPSYLLWSGGFEGTRRELDVSTGDPPASSGGAAATG